MKSSLIAFGLLLVAWASFQDVSAQLPYTSGADCSAYPNFPNQCFGAAGTAYVCCDVQSCGLPVTGQATCSSGQYPPGFPVPPGAPVAAAAAATVQQAPRVTPTVTPAATPAGTSAPNATAKPQVFAATVTAQSVTASGVAIVTPYNPAFDPLQNSWCSGLNHVGPLPGYASVVTTTPNGGVPPDWHCFPGCDGDLSYQVDEFGNPYVKLSNINVSYKAFQWTLPGTAIPVGSNQQVLAWVRLGNGPLQQFTLSLEFVIDGNYNCAGAVLVAQTGCWSLLAAGYQIQVVPNNVYVSIQGITGQDLWVYSVSIISVPQNLYLDDLTARTQAIRTADLNVRVVDANNVPVSGADVTITQTTLGFPMGGSMNSLITSTPAYQQFFNSLFNTAVFENELKWYSTDPNGPTFDYSTPDAMLAWCDANNIKVRGHNIFWDIPSVQQPWVQALSNAGEIPGSPLYQAMYNRLQSVVSHYKGRVIHWDVNNEQFHGGYYENLLGNGIDDWMYPAVKTIDPNVKNALNDYNFVEICSDPVAYPELYLSELAALTNRGIEIDILAFQGQFLGVEPFQFRARLDKIAQAGIPIWMSEVNDNILDDNKRADYLEFIFREAFAHPAVGGFLFWYTTQPQSVYDANGGQCTQCLGNQDYSLNAAGQRILALKKEFTTPPQSGTTDESGSLSTFNAYFGTFQAEILVGGTSFIQNFTTTNVPGFQDIVLSLSSVTTPPVPAPTTAPPPPLPTEAAPVPTPAPPAPTPAPPAPTPAPPKPSNPAPTPAPPAPTPAPPRPTLGQPAPTPAPPAPTVAQPVPTPPQPVPSPAGGTCEGVAGLPNQCYAPAGDTYVCCDSNGCGAPNGRFATCASNPVPVPPQPTPTSASGGTPSGGTPTGGSSNGGTPIGSVPNPSPAGGVCDPESAFPNQCYNLDGSGFVCCDSQSCGPLSNGLATCASGLYS